MINAGHRVKPRPPEEPPRAGVVVCSVCGQRYKPAARKSEHVDSAPCRAQQVTNSYEARGWAQCFNITQSKIILESGVPFEWGLAGVHVEVRNEFDEFGRGRQHNVSVLHKVGFAPKEVIQTANLLARITFPPELRRRAIATLWNVEGVREAIDAARRLDSSGTYRMIMDAMRERELEEQAKLDE